MYAHDYHFFYFLYKVDNMQHSHGIKKDFFDLHFTCLVRINFGQINHKLFIS